MLKHGVGTGTSKGVQVARQSPKISHLFFVDDSLFFMNATNDACLEINCVLNAYEKASGQSVNLRKSSILFSPNLSSKVKLQLAGILGMDQADEHSEYLGLPTVAGLNRRDSLKTIFEKIGSGFKGGKGIFFLKEVLIKSVLQEIPIYVMSRFKLPEGFCQELNSIFSNYWWGSSSNGH